MQAFVVAQTTVDDLLSSNGNNGMCHELFITGHVRGVYHEIYSTISG